jgi:NAD(P)-dependent dehydrogenase (short-subunit alcohol dehydrogenase family)
MKRLTDRVAVVTGAASGIGRHTAIELARRGCHVALADVNRAGLETVQDAVQDLGRRATVHEVDVADREAMSAFADAVLAEHGAVHVLVNNAGVSLTANFEDQSLDDLQWVMDINVWGVVYGCHFFLPHILAQEEGHIVNLSSLFGLIGVPSQSAYCLSKAAVKGFSESLDMELAATQVGLSCIHPGAIATEIVRNGRVRSGVDEARATRLIDKGMPPQRAARIIVDAITAGRKRVLVGRDAQLISVIQRLFPTYYRRLVLRFRPK